jgi:hypothetical protein
MFWEMLPMFRRNAPSTTSGSSWILKMKIIVTYRGLMRLIIVGSRFDDWMYRMSLLQLQLITTVHIFNSFLITNLSLFSGSRTEITSRGPNTEHSVGQFIVLCYSLLLRNMVQFPGKALIYTSIFVAAAICSN